MKQYDEILIQLNKDNVSLGRIKMKLSDMEALMTAHDQSRADVIELLIQTIESEIPKNEEPSKN